MTDLPIDARIAAVAHRQGGHVSRAQLLTLGLSPQSIQRKRAKGQLIGVYLGIYAVGHVPVLPIDRAKGALLACGPDAALSHSSAAALWGFFKEWRAPFEIAAERMRHRAGITVHRPSALGRADIRTHLGVRVTSPTRTLLDIAPRLSEKRLTRLVNDARISRLLRLTDLDELLSRSARHPGRKKLRQFVDKPSGPTRSELEDRFLAFTEQYGLPRPHLNVQVAGHEVDALFPTEKVIVELDGYETHQSRASFEGDRDRDADLLVAGFVTVRITWERLTGRPDREAARLHEVLGQQRAKDQDS